MTNCNQELVLEKSKKRTGSFSLVLPGSPSPYFLFFFFFSSPVVSAGLLPRNKPTLDLVFFPQQKNLLKRPQNLSSYKSLVPVDLMYWFGSYKMVDNLIFIASYSLQICRVRTEKKGAVSTCVRGERGELKTLRTLPWLVEAEMLMLFFVGVMQRTRFS